jgi:hypothetical protein
MKAVFPIVILLGLLAIAVGWAIYGWMQLGDVHMSWHGYAAMILGIVFSLLVGCGLMGLLFYSSRHGYDEPFDPNQSRLNGKRAESPAIGLRRTQRYPDGEEN